MRKSDFLGQLKSLVSGNNPVTNKPLSNTSIMKDYNNIKLLVALIEELEISLEEERLIQEKKKSLEERSAQNRLEGKPERHGFSWTESEKIELKDAFLQDLSPKTIAKAHQRTIGSVISQLLTMKLIDQDEADSYQ
ncbi:hypothetical protein [Vibrio maritimus]|uniref:hypothetical protein n=1 Tax=Vibrio maritimus TaxID=990268 RepID=UPI001F3CC51D|nr:hypothetical protein [Vibrio maritimus]